MKKLRHYMAYCDDGHDCFEFEYTSEHRLNSNGNLKDAYDQHGRKYGIRRFRIIQTWLLDNK